ncbi:glycosyltransferase [Synechococcus sp. WH 8016]|uniref:glycosyltransferase n=1 Tax=Synechococcus sp. WH 8016 TaxID=166318 RepID=UPI00030F66F1|nr:glycosyltransferase [Synechococcus sp. WH 8016]
MIAVPTLNSHALLPRLLHSLQQQSWPHWQLLFIDGPSGVEHRQWLMQCCAGDPRCRWLEQNSDEPGIFGAMNQGFAEASPGDWLLFWGSDDWAAAPTVLARVAASLQQAAAQGVTADLLVCRGRYVDAASDSLTRPTAFKSAGWLNASGYRRALLLGATPPHQATLFGPGARRRMPRYAPGFRLSADLDYFLQLSRSVELVVQCLDLELVHMSAGGISGQQTHRRLQEVRCAYRRAFGWCWFFPFLLRYVRRLVSLLERHC